MTPTGAAAEPPDHVQELMRLVDELIVDTGKVEQMESCHSPSARYYVQQMNDSRATLETAIRAALAHPADTAVPAGTVAWRVRGYAQFKTGKPGPWRYFDGAIEPAVNTPDCCDMEPLCVASPAASTAGATPEALGDAS